jgi:hypothetical protein
MFSNGHFCSLYFLFVKPSIENRKLMPSALQVNLIVYMNPNWKEEWGGHLNLWEGTLDGMTRPAARIAPHFNTAALFRTSDNSWHGMPDPVRLRSVRSHCTKAFLAC